MSTPQEDNKTGAASALDDWKECRTTIGRLDGLLADTRKYGFTLVTVLLTANALVTPHDPIVDRIAASAAVMALIVVLYTIDRYYWILMGAGAQLAGQLEKDLQLRTTTWLRAAAVRTGANPAIASIYYGFVLVAAGVAAVVVWPSGRADAIAWLVGLTAAALLLLVVLEVFLRTDTSRLMAWFRRQVRLGTTQPKGPATQA